ncbi:MAG: UbiA family prenyltransferase [Chloroflexi bacterium]|nr:UbiA family prenyltransferase [Chloroflexota bacterium]
MTWLAGLVRLVHPAPTAAVTTLSAALALILAEQAGGVPGWRVLLIVVAVLGSQILTGAHNDFVDRARDARVQPTKPIPSRAVGSRAALRLAGAGGLLQLAASIPLGPLTLVLGAAASGSALGYNLWLSRTPASVVPYLVSFGLLPLWIAAGIGVDLERVAGASLLVGPFAAAAHLANTLRDFDADAALGSRSLVQVIGRRRGLALAWGLAMGVGIAVGLAFLLSGRLTPLTGLLGTVGMVAVAQGFAGPHRLWIGMLVAAVAWTAAWASASG